MKEYEINEDTMAIIPLNYYQTLVKEKENEYVIDKKAYEVMEVHTKVDYQQLKKS